MSGPVSDRDPLLPQARRSQSRWRRPHPRWLIPLALVASLARGLTLAARVQIVTRLSCDALHRPSRVTAGDLQITSDDLTALAIPTICFTDPAVLASAARVQMLLTVLSGGLAAFTAGRWGKFSDKSGRTKTMSAALLGLVMAEAIYALVSLRHLPFKRRHGHRLLILAPILEGLFGSWPTLQATMNAYLSDITPNGSTSRMFSRFLGLLYIGFAVGPSVASFILRQTVTKDLTPLFYLSSLFYLLSFLFILVVVPESLQPSDKQAPSTSDIQIPARPLSPHYAPYAPFLKLLAPLAALRPRRAGAMRKDYTLTIMAVSYFIYLMSLALYQVKYLYAEHVFSWDAGRVSFPNLDLLPSLTFAARILHLIYGLCSRNHVALWVFVFRPRPLRGRASISPRRELSFDLSLVRFSIFLDVLSHGAVVLAPTQSQSWFVLATTLTSLGSASVPSYSSTVLGYVRYRTAQGEQAEEEDVGALFGALATLQSLGQTIIGPILFGLVSSATVSQYPKGIFVLAFGLASAALVLMLLTRPRKRVILVGARKDPKSPRGRGRSAIPKDITPPTS
ncbi:hypothetical protein PIIN_05747 [Serendipita indica DSM 11827]|uniref:Major facilitator superfamily (MFS) profile domain-containing protein n=1 Tax=Serendipita indica (strain DSM 11827) TaxID=1109443 RepID=G4TKH1_SERID|nr:hypothetical protein PIIN_05747 [Serendipita indica DSM 11827]